MPSEQEAMVELLKWATCGLLAVVGALIVYIWLDHRNREKDGLDGLKMAFGQAIGELKETAKDLTGAIKTLGDSVGKRIDGLELRQGKQETELATERQRVNGVIAVCRERSRHCPLFAPGEGIAHFHRRMADSAAVEHCPQRSHDSELQNDGSGD